MLGCIVEQIAAVSRLRGPVDLSDALECSTTAIPMIVPSVAEGPSVAVPPGNANGSWSIRGEHHMTRRFGECTCLLGGDPVLAVIPIQLTDQLSVLS